LKERHISQLDPLWQALGLRLQLRPTGAGAEQKQQSHRQKLYYAHRLKHHSPIGLFVAQSITMKCQ
jgi:hypothetical protein